MYTENDLTAIRAQIKKRWIFLLVPFILLIAGMLVTAFVRLQEITCVLTVLAGCWFIADYELAVRPLRCYEQHLNNVLHGITHELDCTYSRISADLSEVDGVTYYTMTVVCLDEKNRPYDRMFYYDAALSLPEIAEGTPVRVVYHDHELGAVTVLA